MNRIVGIVVLAAGLGLLYFGYQESESVASGFSRIFSGSPTNRAMMMMIGGGLVCAVGLGIAVRGKGKKKT